MCHNIIGIKLFQIWPKKYSSFFNMLMRYQPIINYCNRARLSFLGIANKTFPLNSSDPSWTVPILKYNSSRIVLNYRLYYYLVPIIVIIVSYVFSCVRITRLCVSTFKFHACIQDAVNW